MNRTLTIFKTLKSLMVSDTPLDVTQLESETGFDRRAIQRHVLTLTEVGMVHRMGTRQGGYRYKFTQPQGQICGR